MPNKSELIKQGLHKGFTDGTSKMVDRICYGYMKDESGNLTINEAEAKTVNFIFESYLSGDSLGKIADKLFKKGIPSPTGKPKWNREAIDKLLSNEKYIGNVLLQKTVSFARIQVKNDGIEYKYLILNNHSGIISQELFDAVQAEKVTRSRGVQFSQSMV